LNDVLKKQGDDAKELPEILNGRSSDRAEREENKYFIFEVLR
jgi:uncharacterized protein (UPF0335 family)